MFAGVPANLQAQETKTKAKAKAPAKADSTTDPVPREGGWMKRHETHLERVKPGKADVVFIGDSITQGWEGAGRDVWTRFYGSRNAVNLGIGGDRTQHVLWRLDHDEVKGINPKVAVVMIGTNNVGGNSADEIAKGVTAIVKSLRDKLPKTKVLLLAVFPRGEKPNSGRDKIKQLNEKIKTLDDGKNVHYLDISKAFLNDDDTISKEIMPDYLHLSPKGYRIWADSIEPTLWKLMEEK
jgi:beta-glucosidase